MTPMPEMPGSPSPDAQAPSAGPGQDGVNQGAIKGEPGTGFEKSDGKGPFECGNCSFFQGGNSCAQEDMKSKSQQPKNPDGSVQVDEDDCCEFVDRTGKDQEQGEPKQEGEALPATHPLQQLRAKPKSNPMLGRMGI